MFKYTIQWAQQSFVIMLPEILALDTQSISEVDLKIQI